MCNSRFCPTHEDISSQTSGEGGPMTNTSNKFDQLYRWSLNFPDYGFIVGAGSTPLHYAACGGNLNCCQRMWVAILEDVIHPRSEVSGFHLKTQKPRSAMQAPRKVVSILSITARAETKKKFSDY
ncbi:hypothetical protein MKW98_011079 [Papaver atlanticum]|uniref:Uncharacterized protein n=1 Tax=Papaver atlanticum TaxID=357466 RepID=A0AAD4XY79_9MAGN|nr:hypothetical protein MKW98_011079 [Papaver atlanticum]